MKKRSAIVYGLMSTRDSIVKYIGQTNTTIESRLKAHLRDACKKTLDNNPKCDWIREEISDGYEIRPIILMKDCYGEVNERRLLDAYELSGHQLVNSMHMRSYKERQIEGIRAARERGIRFGRNPTSPEQIKQVKEMLDAGVPIRKICSTVKVSPNTVGIIKNTA
jgi:hypothetical protein